MVQEGLSFSVQTQNEISKSYSEGERVECNALQIHNYKLNIIFLYIFSMYSPTVTITNALVSSKSNTVVCHYFSKRVLVMPSSSTLCSF